MKKIVLITLTVLILSCCQMYKTTDVVVMNNSSESAIVSIKNFKDGDKQVLNRNFTISAGGQIVLPFYDNGNVNLESIGRNYLKKVTDTNYEILNADNTKFTFYNNTTFPVIVKDLNNLFDMQTIAVSSNKPNIDVYNANKIQPLATTSDGTNLVLKTTVSISGRVIVVSL